MPHLGVADRVKETTTTTGTGTIDLAGAVEGYQTFVAGIGNGHETYYSISNRDADEWEVGYGTISDAATDTLSRSVVISSSNGGSLVNFSAGTKDVICTLPADRSFVIDDEANVSVTANVTATAFSGDGSSLTALNISTDSTPSLGGNLDLNSNDITGTGNIDITGTGTFTVSDNSHALELISTDADASVGPRISLYRNSASPADNDILGDIRFMGENDASAKLEYAKIEAKALDVSSGSRDTQLTFQIRHTDSGCNSLILTPTEAVFNDGSFDTDFRVESNNNANMLFVDAGTDRVGIGTSSPDTNLDIRDTGANNGGTLTLGTTNDTTGGDYGAIQFYKADASGAGAGVTASITATDGASSGANSELVFATGDSGSANTERMRIDSSGNVGIGTTSPGAKLDVESQINVTNSNNISLPAVLGSEYGYNSSYRTVVLGPTGTTTSDNIAIGYDPSINASGSFSGNGSELLFRNGISFLTPNSTDTGYHRNNIVMKDGNVGIGTTSPSTALDVTGTVTADGLTFQSEGDTITFPTSSAVEGRIKTGDSLVTNSFQLEADNALVLNSGMDDSGSASNDFVGITRGSTFINTARFESNGDIGFYEDTGTNQKLFWDASAESLGIGTSSPSHELDIQSSGQVTQQLKTTSSVHNAILYLDGGVNADSVFRWLGDGTNYYQLYRDGSQDQDLRLYSPTDTAGETDILRYSINGDLRFGTNASERMRIDSSGNVGIGTTSPSTALDVNGTITAVTLVESSSLVYKENVQPLEFNEAIYNVNAVKYDRKDGSSKDEVGVIAEELYKVLPDLVSLKDGKPEAVKYTKMTMYLLEALKKQNKEIQLLKEKLNG